MLFAHLLQLVVDSGLDGLEPRDVGCVPVLAGQVLVRAVIIETLQSL